jgi:hypothetical protein
MEMNRTILTLRSNRGHAEQPPSPCHPNPNADQDMAAVAARGDIASLPAPLQSQILRIAGRPHSQLPTQTFNEADEASQLFQYVLLDTNGFEPKCSRRSFRALTITCNSRRQAPTAGYLRSARCGVVLEPKPGLPLDPNNPRAFISGRCSRNLQMVGCATPLRVVITTNRRQGKQGMACRGLATSMRSRSTICN